jgi:AcrR family transcriptional regulator
MTRADPAPSPVDSSKTKWGDKATRRLDILLAARQQLAVRGYAGLNMREVAGLAKVSPGLLYSYFANKEELFATLYAERLAEFQGEMLQVSQQVETVEQLFVALLKAYLPVYKVYGREFNLFSLLRQPNAFNPQISAQLTQTAMQLMGTLYHDAQRLLGAQEAKISDLAQPELVLPMFWIVLSGLAEHYAGDRQHLYGHDPDTMAAFIAQTLMLGLRSQAACHQSSMSNTAQG